MAGITPEQALIILQESELLYLPEQIDSALDRIANDITDKLGNRDPLVLMVMNGAFITAARLLARLRFPLRVGYLHATRYQNEISGSGKIDWIASPRPPVIGQVVLVIDDIFDEGNTLQSIVEEIYREGAAEVYSAVLINKQHDHKIDFSVDYVGLKVPDCYVFGCGMDYKEYWRNLPAIYSVRQ
jgi:hypoxanthine phosphoribosyltransferase